MEIIASAVGGLVSAAMIALVVVAVKAYHRLAEISGAVDFLLSDREKLWNQHGHLSDRISRIEGIRDHQCHRNGDGE